MTAIFEELLVDLIDGRTGFVVPLDEVERKLMPLVDKRTAALALLSPWAYLERLRAEPASGAEWRRLIEGLTNGQTTFFRDPEQFAAIAQVLSRHPPGRPLWLWSAGCSTGEEPLSLAIIAAELGRAEQTRIVATDINQEHLDRAAAGRFRPWALRQVDEARLARWFEPEQGLYRARDELRRMIDLRAHNVVIDEPPRPGGADDWHGIVCRNVFIYLRRERIAATCHRLASVLAANGWLALAASESIRGLGVALEAEVIRGRIFHRRRRAGMATPAAAPASAPTADGGRVFTAGPPADQALIDEALAHARRGAVREALDRLLAGPASGEHTLTFHLAHGHLRLRLHEIDAALGAYRRAADIDPLQCEVHYFEGVAQRKAGAWAAAAAPFRRALFLAPTFWQAAYLLAGVHDRLGNERDAERERDRARRALLDGSMRVVFLSDPLFVDWLSITEKDARRALQLPPRELS